MLFRSRLPRRAGPRPRPGRGPTPRPGTPPRGHRSGSVRPSAAGRRGDLGAGCGTLQGASLAHPVLLIPVTPAVLPFTSHTPAASWGLTVAPQTLPCPASPLSHLPFQTPAPHSPLPGASPRGSLLTSHLPYALVTIPSCAGFYPGLCHLKPVWLCENHVTSLEIGRASCRERV